jgi:thioredoxin-related protein
MKKITIAIALFLNATLAIAQLAKDTAAPYLKANGIPGFNILLSDSVSWFNNQSLPSDKLIALVFFSPGCEHCQATAQEMIEKKDSLQDIFMVWTAGFMDEIADIKTFKDKYKLGDFNNIIIGKELTYSMPLVYRLETTPYIVFYKNNKYVTEIRSAFKASDIIAVINNKYVPPVVIEEKKQIKINNKFKKKSKRNSGKKH